MVCLNDFSHLSIKRISLQLIHTLEIMSVALCHYQTVLVSLEEVSFIKRVIFTSGEVPLPLGVDVSAPLPILTKPCGLLLVSVEIDYQGKPE